MNCPICDMKAADLNDMEAFAFGVIMGHSFTQIEPLCCEEHEKLYAAARDWSDNWSTTCPR